MPSLTRHYSTQYGTCWPNHSSNMLSISGSSRPAFTPDRRASPHFGRYSCAVPRRVGGWVGAECCGSVSRGCRALHSRWRSSRQAGKLWEPRGTDRARHILSVIQQEAATIRATRNRPSPVMLALKVKINTYTRHNRSEWNTIFECSRGDV